MKNFLILFFALTSISLAQAQRWQVSKDCNENVNDQNWSNFGRSGIISASVKLSFCSGTLINRNTNNEDVGFYVLTANHCVDDINFNVEQTVYFNYQSPDENDLSTPISNRGIDDEQSTSLLEDGYQYHHKTRLRLVNRFFWGDMALVEILTPVPPHFNVAYAGWNPSRFHNGLSFGIQNLFGLPTDYVAIHHPRGDIKKISGTNQILWLENPIATGCYTITTIIDVLFGWLWGNSVSTSVICNYVDNPWLGVPAFQYGILEPWSSGSGMFNIGNEVIGVCSGGIGGCVLPVFEYYGKLHANYSNASIKNILNPSNNVWVDLFGMDERKIDCYNNLVLPGAPGVSGHYFPANHYQAENKIVLRSINDITVNDNIQIHSGADYEFIAGGTVNIENNFQVAADVDFAITTGVNTCTRNNRSSFAMEQTIINRLNEILLPKEQVLILVNI